MNDEHVRQVLAIIEGTTRLASKLEEELGRRDGVEPLLRGSNKLWFAQFPPSTGWGERLHLDLSGADFSGALFAGDAVSLKGANFTNATLDRTRWLCATLSKADFMHASLRNSSFIMCAASGTTFSGADLRDAHIHLCSSDATDFTGADLRNAELELGMTLGLPTNFCEANLLLTGANMEGCRVSVFSAKFVDDPKGVRGEQLYKFLQSLSEEQKRQVTFTEPTLQPLEPSISKCFIATAVYGSPSSPQVRLLQQYRQEHLQPHWFGRLLIRVYYQVSPSLADWIRKRPRARRAVRRILDTALVILARGNR